MKKKEKRTECKLGCTAESVLEMRRINALN
jgi:hypothetical protein